MRGMIRQWWAAKNGDQRRDFFAILILVPLMVFILVMIFFVVQ